MVSLGGAQLRAPGIDKPDGRVGMLAMIRHGDSISGPGGFFGKPVIPVFNCWRRSYLLRSGELLDEIEQVASDSHYEILSLTTHYKIIFMIS